MRFISACWTCYRILKEGPNEKTAAKAGTRHGLKNPGHIIITGRSTSYGPREPVSLVKPDETADDDTIPEIDPNEDLFAE